ncbi:MAG: FIST N-terminal domain-containing protein [Syntrophobacteraceae bacterium]|nr:FIST N-terminal domain-containing protein [Syntrophobacteraceae bacterium]
MFKAKTITLKGRFSLEAGRQMGKGLVEALGDKPGAVWLFASPGKGLRGLLAGIADTVETENIIGCTTDGEISCSGFGTGSAVLGGIATDRIEFHVASAKGIGDNSEAAGKKLAEKLPGSVRYVQAFSDGLTGDGCGILRGMMSVLGDSMPICGGAAADGIRFQETRQFCGREFLTDSVVGIGFSGDIKVGAGVRSGWSPIGIARKVTRSRKQIVYELDGQPALEVYSRLFGKHAENLPMVGIEYPLGLVDCSQALDDPDYNVVLRASVSINDRDGSIRFAGEIPEGAMVRLTCGDLKCTLEAAGRAAKMALQDLGDCTPAMVFFFSCMARRTLLGRRTEEEVEKVRLEAGADVPILGFYSYGEFCPAKRGRPSLLHNETATVSILGFNR